MNTPRYTTGDGLTFDDMDSAVAHANMVARTTGNIIAVVQIPTYYECGICGHCHPIDWDGDCRDDANRYTYAQLDARHGGPDGYHMVDMPD